MGTTRACEESQEDESVKRGVLRRELEPLWRASSALTIGDLLDIARARESDARLEKIYEWYFVRTMTTIRVAFGAAGVSFAALFGVVFRRHEEPTAQVILVGAVMAFVLMGGIQMRLLAQLHREFAVSLRLLAEVSALAEMSTAAPSSGRPRPPEGQPTRKLAAAAFVGLVAAVVAPALFLWLAANTASNALAAAAFSAVLILSLVILAEIQPDEGPCSKRTCRGSGDVLSQLAANIGRERLDDYVFDEGTQTKVNDAIVRVRSPAGQVISRRRR